MPVSRLAALQAGNLKVSLPAFFPSVSSIKTSPRPISTPGPSTTPGPRRTSFSVSGKLS